MSIKQQIEALLADVEPSVALNILEKVALPIRRANSKRINEMQYGRLKVDKDRPDLVAMKKKQ